MKNKFDVIVVGAGHAGVEAAWAASKMGSKTLLLTIDINKIALMPCNPSIGGLGKGHIVYEVSALGGLMPKLCSQTYLQARMLNTSKGPAVQGLRLQIDKYAYSKLAQEILLNTSNLTVIEGMVTEILSENKKITGVKTNDGQIYYANAIVVTTGTFLNGLIHIGFDKSSGGRREEQACFGLTESLEKITGLKFGRLKTGTPPRLLKSSINFDKLEEQQASKLNYLFEFDNIDVQEKVTCYVAQTNEKTHEIIKNNFSHSALYGGQITGIGPRYCPSIESKIERYPDRSSHHVFVEPEGGDFTEIYPAGLSTSLPLDIQEQYIKSIKGFENAIIVRPGYAIEYDFLQPKNLKHSLEVKTIEGLFFAGQINGTTGYEEAAGLGLVAGVNAHLKVNKQEPFILNRTESYIGVMIDDLISLGVDEPYRMFTSRAERRLLLRQDNVFLRLTPYAYKLDLISQDFYNKFLQEKNLLEKGLEFLSKINKQDILFKLFHDIDFEIKTKYKAQEVLAQKLGVKEKDISDRALLNLHAHIRYSGYIEKEALEIEKTVKYQNLKISKKLIFSKISGLSVEMQQKLNYYKPITIAQAQLIPGMTPAAISILIFQSRLAEQDIK